MAQGGDFIGGVAVAAGAGVGGKTFFGAGGCGDSSGVAVGMFLDGDILVSGLTADGTGKGSDTGLGLGGFSGDLALVPDVTRGGDRFLLRQDDTATLAMGAIGQTILGAAGVITLVDDFFVPQGGDGFDVAVAAFGACIGAFAAICAGGFLCDSGCIGVDAAFVCRIIVCIIHGIGGVERGCVIFRVAGMIFEIGGADQEIPIVRAARVPGGVQIIVQVIEPGDVPAMGTTAVTGNEPRVHAQLQGQPVQQQGIALADRGAIQQRGVAGVLQGVAAVVQVGVVVYHIGADIVIDGAELLIIGGGVDIQFIQKGVHSLIHDPLLGSCGIVGDNEGNFPVDGTVRGIGTGRGILPAAVLPFEVVTFDGIAGVGEGQIKGFLHEGFQNFTVGSRCVDVQRDGIQAIYHALADDQRHFLGGTQIFRRGSRNGGQPGRIEGHGAQNIFIKRIDVGFMHMQGIGVPCMGGGRENTCGEYGDDHSHHQQRGCQLAESIHGKTSLTA